MRCVFVPKFMVAAVWVGLVEYDRNSSRSWAVLENAMIVSSLEVRTPCHRHHRRASCSGGHRYP
jgi:hypothetical protein